MGSLGMKSQCEACFVNSVIQCLTDLCSAAEKSASLLEKRLRNTLMSNTEWTEIQAVKPLLFVIAAGLGNISGVQISRDKENIVRATVLHIIYI